MQGIRKNWVQLPCLYPRVYSLEPREAIWVGEYFRRVSVAETEAELGPVLGAPGQTPGAQKALGSRGEEQWGPTGLTGQRGAKLGILQSLKPGRGTPRSYPLPICQQNIQALTALDKT